MFLQLFYYALDRMLTHPTPLTLCHFELRAYKYRFDIENKLFYIFRALIYSTHRFKRYK